MLAKAIKPGNTTIRNSLPDPLCDMYREKRLGLGLGLGLDSEEKTIFYLKKKGVGVSMGWRESASVGCSKKRAYR